MSNIPEPVGNEIQRLFPDLPENKLQSLLHFASLLSEWNTKINLISRKETEFLFERHIFHAMLTSIPAAFLPQARVLDIGTGGGFPGIPLAILFPQTAFTLCDSIGKKISVVQNCIEELKLTNVVAIHARAESIPGSFDYVVSRAVAPIKDLMNWSTSKLVAGKKGALSNGWILLKGLHITEEIIEARAKANILPLKNFTDLPYFEEKAIIHIAKTRGN